MRAVFGIAFLLGVLAQARADGAHAESPIGVIVNPSLARATLDPSDGGASTVFALRVDVGYRVNPVVMVGAHVGAATASDLVVDYFYSPGDSDTYTYNYRPIDAGLAIVLQAHESVHLGAWLGAERGWMRLGCHLSDHSNSPDTSPSSSTCGPGEWSLHDGTSPALGLAVGVDVAKSGPHRLSITLSADTAVKTKHRDFQYSALALGVAYRFWP